MPAELFPQATPVLSVVVPLFNEEENAPELLRRLVESCRSLGVPFELLVVNDGSQDNTLPLLVESSRAIPELRVVDLFRNFGHMPALTAGLELARGQGIVVMDGDLQDPPEVIPSLYREWRAGADVVYAQRVRRGEPLFLRLATRLFYALLRGTTRIHIPKQAGTFCLMDRRVVEILRAMPERNRFFAGLRAWVGGRQAQVAYERPRRSHGRSRVGIRGLIRLGLMALVSFSKVPLRYASLLSLACGLILFLVGSWAIVLRLFTRVTVPGWATSTALIGMMGFIQSVVLAAISEYIGQIFDEVKRRPLYLVREEFARGSAVRPVYSTEPKDSQSILRE